VLDHASEFGNQRQPTIVVLPPAGATRHVWTPHARRLADDWHVVAVDLPAHGTHPDDTFAFESAVADVGAVLQTTETGVVAGHSLGGYVALRAATAHEARVDGLLLAGAHANFRTPKGIAISALSFVFSPALDVAARSERLTAWLEARLDDTRDDQQPPEDLDVHPSPSGLAKGMRASALQRTWPHVTAYDGPTRLVHGTDEGLADHARELAARADATRVHIDGGHQAPTNDVDAFTDVLDDFATTVHAK